MIDTCVVDASVGIKLFVQEQGSDQADRLFQQLATHPDTRFYVPDLFFVECANILWKYVRNFDYPAENARQDIADLRSLALNSVSTADLIVQGLELALEYEITAYDACYAALAMETHLPMITADRPLSQKLKGSEIEITLLKEVKV